MRAITIAPTIWSSQHKIAPPKHIDIASKTPFGEKQACMNTLVADASQCILHKYLNRSYVNIYKWRFFIDCVLGFGHHDNIFTSTAQINYSSPSGGILRRSCRLLGACMLITLMTLPITPASFFLAIYLNIPSLAAFASHCNANTVSRCPSPLLSLGEHTHILVMVQFGLILHVRPSLFQSHHNLNSIWGIRTLLLFAAHASL
jgi:hypothetical protein